MWLSTIIRNVFFAFDEVIYHFISLLYELLMYLANIDFFGTNADVVSTLLERVYAILGIFMLFKVSFSVLQYIVDPNSFSDQSKGMGKLLTNVIVVLVLLALTPTLFSLAFELQSTILNSNIIGTLILGNSVGDSISGDEDENDEDENDEDETINSINATLANDIKFLVFGTFFTVNKDLISACTDTPVLGTKAMAGNTPCLEQVNDLMVANSVNIYDFFRITNTDNRDFDSFIYLLDLSQDNEYYFEYQFGVSTVAGIFIVVMMLAYCIDVAVRVIKLFFLELIAPIPIVSYVDPKQGKDGMLYKWAKECGSTYASLFMRLAIIFLAFFLIDMIASMNLTDSDTYFNEDVPEGSMAVLVQVMLVLGILIFAGQVPKLIEKIFGFELSGELGINPLKRITSSPVASAAVGGVIGAGVGSVLGATNAWNASRGLGRGKGRSFGSAVGGIFSGMARGGVNAVKGKDKGLGLLSAVGSIGAIQDSIRMRKETGAGGQIDAAISELTGAPYKRELFDQQVKARQDAIDNIDKAKKRAEDWVDKQDYMKALKRELEAKKLQAGNAKNEKERQAALADIDDLEKRIKRNKDNDMKFYIENGIYNSKTGQYEKDAQIEAYLQAAQRVVAENEHLDGLSSFTRSDGTVDWDKAEEVKKAAETANIQLQSSNEYEDSGHEKEIRQKSAARNWTNKQN